MKEETDGFHRVLGAFDFTLLVIGAVIGADIYVVASMGADNLGPAQLVAWVVAGLLAALIALAFVQCAAIDSDVGGSYAYARSAFGPFVGFLAGWALYVGEFVALPVFPLAFINYLAPLVGDVQSSGSLVVKVSLVALVTAVNLRGVRQGARLNNVLTLAKLVPLASLIVLGVALVALRPGVVGDHISPFAPLGWGGFGSAVLPIFWAYAGFELAVLPAAEVRNPQVTLPFGLIVGMLLAIALYLLTAIAVVCALPWQAAAVSASPLASAMDAVLKTLGLSSGVGVAFMSLGALISIAGVYAVFTLGIARLSYALAADGLFPAPFARIHPRFGTPQVGLVFEGIAAVIGATLFDLRGLITVSVFFLGLSYLLTALAALRLVQRNPTRALRLPGLNAALILAGACAVYLSSQVPMNQIAIGAGVMLLGAALYMVRAGHWRHLTAESESKEHDFERWTRSHYRWLLDSARTLVVGNRRSTR